MIPPTSETAAAIREKIGAQLGRVQMRHPAEL
jgi:hypothetical protein